MSEDGDTSTPHPHPHVHPHPHSIADDGIPGALEVGVPPVVSVEVADVIEQSDIHPPVQRAILPQPPQHQHQQQPRPVRQKAKKATAAEAREHRVGSEAKARQTNGAFWSQGQLDALIQFLAALPRNSVLDVEHFPEGLCERLVLTVKGSKGQPPRKVRVDSAERIGRQMHPNKAWTDMDISFAEFRALGKTFKQVGHTRVPCLRNIMRGRSKKRKAEQIETTEAVEPGP